MSSVNVDKSKCPEILKQMDLYLDGSLPQGPARECSAHLEQCVECAAELELRKKLRVRLRSAARSIEPPAYLEGKIRSNLAAPRPATGWWMQVAAAAATVAVCVGLAGAYHFGHLRLTPAAQESYVTSVSSRVATLMRVGLGDHVHCAVFRKYPANPPSLAQMASSLGPEFAGVIPVVREHAPGDLRLILAHHCSYHDRKFVHLVLRNDTHLLSVIFTRKSEGEALTRSELAPAITEAGLSIYESSVQRFQIASFESRDYLVYIISDEPSAQNREMMQAMAPALKAFLNKLEG